MAVAEKNLPSDLVGEILCRMPTKSLARCRAVCRLWRAIWEDKNFLDKYLARERPRFIVRNNCQICSVEINIDLDHVSPIEVRDITLDIPCTSLVHCEGLLLSRLSKVWFAVWNPWLRQKRLIQNYNFRLCGLGYDRTRPETGYKIFGYDFVFDGTRKLNPKVAIYDCKYDVWKFIDAPSEKWRVPPLDSIVSMSGNLYWIACDLETSQYFIRSFDFSKEIFETICALPINEDIGYTQALAVFRVDRLSVLRQSYLTGKIELLVTKQKIGGNGEAVVWITFMTVSIPNFPRLQHRCLDSQPSYFIDAETLFVCTCDETGHACIYVVKRDAFRKFPIDSVVGLWPSHLTYIPSFVPIPSIQREPQRQTLQKNGIFLKSFSS